jgi:L-lactate dehydrogenase complex protein LldF
MQVKEIQEQFLASSTVKAADREHRRKINFNIGKYNAVVPKGSSNL